MEKMIGFDFKFIEFSKNYGEFIFDALTSYPEGKIEKVSHYYDLKQNDIVYLHFSCPESVACFVKLKYGGFIVTRPEIKKELDYEELFERYNSKRSRYIKNKIDFNNYSESLKYLSKKITDINYDA